MADDIEARMASLEALVERRFVETETRLAAMQYMVAQLFRFQYRATNAPQDWVDDSHEKLKSMFSKMVYGGNDPALSDHYSAEIERWVSDIIDDVNDLRFAYKEGPNKRS